MQLQKDTELQQSTTCIVEAMFVFLPDSHYCEVIFTCYNITICFIKYNVISLSHSWWKTGGE